MFLIGSKSRFIKSHDKTKIRVVVDLRQTFSLPSLFFVKNNQVKNINTQKEPKFKLSGP